MAWWHILFNLPEGLALAAGIYVLTRRRRRSRKATGLALAALYILATWWAVEVGVRVAVNGFGALNALPPDAVQPVVYVYSGLRTCWHAGCLLLLVYAVVADRCPGQPGEAEADYADAERTK